MNLSYREIVRSMTIDAAFKSLVAECSGFSWPMVACDQRRRINCKFAIAEFGGHFLHSEH